MSQSVDFAGQILILTGSPGSGKTTTAALLAELPGSPKVHLHSDDFWGFIRNGRISPYLPDAHGQNEVVMTALAGVVEPFAKGGFFVVLDGIIGPWFLHHFRVLGVPMHYVVLSTEVETAIRRCKERGDDSLTHSGPIADLHRQFSALGDLDRHRLDVTGATREEALQKVIAAVQSEAFRL